ncbi:putative extracellular exo-polygalacturonase [Aspergillus ibericus CBS 121593]|uniref:galacturonan 1,4-alpha-galacturonidase n=1 Tax=Aspergillus ibericus CBS 121593 TaxID=1448316 RepID=A0A395H4S3_9EURO|nr:pectin lyase-like protein [Aspergillus ibericus CBS 121593]RAL02892.1 pectin lyase-like protein [Aspergillus ibericus CBS 121593]
MSIFRATLVLLLSASASIVRGVPHSPRTTQSRTQQCVIPSKYNTSNGLADDSPAVSQAFAQCATDSVIVFEEGISYNIFHPIKATNLSNVEIRMHGNLHLPQNITAVQNIVNGGSSIWFTFEGPQVDWIGPENVNHGWIESHGQPWWDANPANGTGIDGRPHLLSLKTSQATVKYFRSRKPIAWNFKLYGQDITVSHAIIDATSTGSFPFNTDGFDVEGTNIQITDSIVYNGDDAIAVASGSHDILFTRNTIGYQTHGMSIGSLGEDASEFANVTNIRFEDVTVIDGLYAARFKSWSGGQGLVKNVTWNNIRVYNVTFPIYVTQSYTDQGASSSSTVNASSAVMMEDFTWSDFSGSINTYQPGDGSCVSDPCWYNVGLPNLKHTEALILECHTTQSCSDFVTANLQLYPQSLEPASVICMDATAALNAELGFECRNGTYDPLTN